MSREKYKNRVKDILCHKSQYAHYNQENFKRYNYGEMTPVNNDLLPEMPNGKIILTEEVYSCLQAVLDVTNLENQEIPFFLYGREIENNVVVFDEFFSQSEQRKGYEADFSKAMIDNLKEKIKSDNFILCHGHSHPAIGAFYDNFSFGDLTSYMQMRSENAFFTEKNIDLIGGIVTADGNFNFLFNDNNNFYRFLDVMVQDKNGNLMEIKSYNQEKSRGR